MLRQLEVETCSGIEVKVLRIDGGLVSHHYRLMRDDIGLRNWKINFQVPVLAGLIYQSSKLVIKNMKFVHF